MLTAPARAPVTHFESALALNQALGLEFKRWPCDATFLYLYRFAEA